MPMTPHAMRAPAWPVVFESAWPPQPRSSSSAWLMKRDGGYERETVEAGQEAAGQMRALIAQGSYMITERPMTDSGPCSASILS